MCLNPAQVNQIGTSRLDWRIEQSSIIQTGCHNLKFEVQKFFLGTLSLDMEGRTVVISKCVSLKWKMKEES